MATDLQKKENLYWLSSLTLISLASGAWNTLGESVFAMSGMMGEEILSIMEKSMGLEIAGENPEEVIMEISRIFIDEFGFCSDIDVTSNGPDHYEVKVKNCINRRFTDKLLAAGVEKPYVCPVMNACQAAFRRMNFKMHEDVEKWEAGNGSIITFTGI